MPERVLGVEELTWYGNKKIIAKKKVLSVFFKWRIQGELTFINHLLDAKYNIMFLICTISLNPHKNL